MFKNGNEILINANGTFTLVKGATLKTAKGSLNAKALELRKDASAVDSATNTTLKDIIFNSASGLASFVEGSQTNGNKYLGLASTTTSSSTATTTTPRKTPRKKTENNTESVNEENAENTNTESVKPMTEKEITKYQMSVVDEINNFCKDFAFQLDNRMLNNLGYLNGVQAKRDYIINVMELTNYDEGLIKDASSKMKNAEFKNLSDIIDKIDKTHGKINNRLVIYYGVSGSGKTTKAHERFANAYDCVASATQDPDDLFTAFNPATNSYELTTLGYAMVNGKYIVVNEVNFYNEATLKRLQGVLDNTEVLLDRGIEIKIHKDFKMIMTMNLEIQNQGKYPLPFPLVSRAEEIECFDKVHNFNVW